MDDRMFRDAMGKFPTGVTVITAANGGNVHGMTANAFMSVSLDPKLISVSVDEKAHMHSKMTQTEMFAVSILREDQKSISMNFAGQKKDSVIDFEWHNGVPVIKNALANIICKVYQSIKIGDHTLFVGEVLDLKLNQGTPLAYFEGKYVQVEPGLSQSN